MTRKVAVEGIGTFFLMLTIGLAVQEPGAGTMAPLAIGTVLMVMVYAGGHVSGAHYNPAVTLAVLVRGRATPHDLVGYWVLQIVAAALAAVTVLWFKGQGPLMPMDIEIGPVLMAEFLFTFALAFVVLNVATVRGVEGNSYYGLAIGFTVMAGAYAVGPVSGGAFNPAVTLGSFVIGSIELADLWVFLVAQLLGGGAAATMFNVFDLGGDAAARETTAG